MPAPDAAVARLARRQHAVVSRAQARECGLTDRMIQHRLQVGRFVTVRRSVFRIAGTQPTWKQALMAACLAAGPGAIISHQSAAALFRFDGFTPRTIEITVARGRRHRLPDVTVHTTGLLPRSDVTTLDRIPVTTPTRTLIDLSASVRTDRLEEALDSALRDELVALERLSRRLASMRVSGRSTAALVELVGRRVTGAVPQSVLERRFLRLMARHGLPKPTCQLPVRRPDGRYAFLDFAWVAEGVAVEVDGHQSHSTRLQRQRDNERSNAVVLTDFRTVLRFSWEHVTQRQQYVVRTVAHALGLALGPGAGTIPGDDRPPIFPPAARGA